MFGDFFFDIGMYIWDKVDYTLLRKRVETNLKTKKGL